jgi:hypothetical protein
VQAGLDVVIPMQGFWGAKSTAVLNGFVDLERLEGMTERVLLARYFLRQDEVFLENGAHPYNVEHPIIDVRIYHSVLI